MTDRPTTFKRFESTKYRGYEMYLGENAVYIYDGYDFLDEAPTPTLAMNIIDDWMNAK